MPASGMGALGNLLSLTLSSQWRRGDQQVPFPGS
jgi:hypothetical protein